MNPVDDLEGVFRMDVDVIGVRGHEDVLRRVVLPVESFSVLVVDDLVETMVVPPLYNAERVLVLLVGERYVAFLVDYH